MQWSFAVRCQCCIVLLTMHLLAPQDAMGRVFFELSPLPGAEASFGSAINASGIAVGRSRDQNLDSPTIWLLKNGQYVAAALPTLPGLPSGGANSINDAGVISGYLQPSDGDGATAVVWTPDPGGAYGPPIPLPVPGGMVLSASYSIGPGGAVAGFGLDTNMRSSALAWLAEPGSTYPKVTTLPALPNAVESVATAVNADGDIAGYFLAANKHLNGAVWVRQPDDTFIAHPVIAGSDTVIVAMNHYGTGAGVHDGDQPLVMVYFEGEFYAINLQLPVGSSEGATNAVNNHHALAGFAKDNSTPLVNREAALWAIVEGDDWTYFNLDQWLDDVDAASGSNRTLVEVTGLSDDWKIIGDGVFQPPGFPEMDRAFVLDVQSLVPEPAGAAWLVAAGFLILIRRSSQ